MSDNDKAKIDDGGSAFPAGIQTCAWIDDAGGNWYTGCQEIHVFISGTPQENGYVFCPYCGGKIEKEDGI